MRIKYIVFLIAAGFLFQACDKMEEKKTTSTQNQQNLSNRELPPDHPPINKTESSNTDSKSESDEMVAKVKKNAEEADALYEKDKSETNKKNAIDKNLAAGNYMMLEADVPAKEKYRPALKFYRRVLALDPKNQEALANKKQIEDIYVQMGLPIPQ